MLYRWNVTIDGLQRSTVASKIHTAISNVLVYDGPDAVTSLTVVAQRGPRVKQYARFEWEPSDYRVGFDTRRAVERGCFEQCPEGWEPFHQSTQPERRPHVAESVEREV